MIVFLRMFFCFSFFIMDVNAEVNISHEKYKCLNEYKGSGLIKKYRSESEGDFLYNKSVKFNIQYVKGDSLSISWEDIFNLEEIKVDFVSGERYLRRDGKFKKAKYYEDIIAISSGVSSGLSYVMASLLLQDIEYIERLSERFIFLNNIDKYSDKWIFSERKSILFLEDGMVKKAVISFGVGTRNENVINIIDFGDMEYDMDYECLNK